MLNSLRTMRRSALALALVPAIAFWQTASATAQPTLPVPQRIPAGQAPGPVPDMPQTQDGIEVQQRGPVHEGFALPYDKNVAPAPVVPKKPPAPIPEEPPEQKPAAGNGQNVEWIPGYWGWDAERNDFLWISGFWRVPPPGRKWVPGHWAQVNGGWQWVAGLWGEANRPLQYLPQPPASVENGPSVPAPDDNSVYIPGAWQYMNDNYMWRPGYWYPAYSDWVWTPSYYSWTPNGCVYVNGYWDYPLVNRGTLFAPVYFNQPLWQTAGWAYRPWFAVDIGNWWGSLFIGPYRNSYFFGNYYSPFYARAGFWPWYSWGRNYYDPLFNHARWANRGNPNWYAGLRNTYWTQRSGNFARAGSLAGVNGIRAAGNAPGLVRPLNQLNRTAALNRVSPAQLRQVQANTQQFRDLSQQRNRTELPSQRLGGPNASPRSGGANVARQSGYSGPTINNGGRMQSNAAPFREQANFRSSAPHSFQSPAIHNSAPAYRGSSHAMPSRSAPSFHSGATFHGGGGGGHGGGGHKH
ncbi:MAG TPA: hypothetical protein VGY66_03980 [Gemmataceae bacterium]|jgi:hypothetical protein|nr:hypothetical protein [Gemmataceae bacterium]